MKKKALRKDFYMEIKKSLNRFLSILLIVALGVAFYSGIQSAAPDMRYSGDEYFDEHRLMDLKVVGTLGLTEHDAEALRQIEGIAAVEPGYMTDALCGGETQKVLHIESISPTLNQLTPAEGRLPEKSGECFVDIEFLDSSGYAIGDRITFYGEDGDDLILRRKTFEIVGAGSSPLYISFGRGNTTLGSGEIDGAGYILPEDFDAEVYTQIYMEVRGARNLTAYTDAYDTLIERVMQRVEAIEGAQCEYRYREVMDEAEEKLADARQELEDGRREGESELADALKELQEGESELADGKQELADAREEVAEGESELAEGESELAESRDTIARKEQELADARTELADGWAELEKGKSELAGQEEKFNDQYKDGMAEIRSGEKQLQQAKEQLDAGRQEYEQGLAQYLDGQAEYAAGEQEYAKGAAEYREQAAAWPGQKKELEAQRAELEENRTKLEDALPQMNEKLAELQEQQTDAQQQRDMLAQQIDALNGRISETQQTVEALNGQITGTQQAIDALTSEQSSMESHASDMQGQAESYAARSGELSSAIGDADARIGELKTRAAELAAALDRARASEETDQGAIADLEGKLASVQEKLDGENSSRASLQSELDTVNGQLSWAQGELGAAQQRLAAIPGEIEGAQGTLSTLQGSLENAQAALSTLQESAAPLTEKLSQADAGLTALKEGIAKLQTEIETQNGNLKTVTAGIEQIDAGISEAESALTAGERQLSESWIKLDQAKTQLDTSAAQLEAAQKEIQSGEKEIAANEKKLEEGRQKLADGKKQIASAHSTIAENEQKLIDAQAQIDDGARQLADGRQQLADGEQEIADARKELEDGRKEIADAEKEIAEAESELADGWKEYEDGKKEFASEIADGEQKIADAKQEIADLKEPEWIIDDRSSLPENIGYGENADRMRSLGTVFPTLFFLVAALISLTTMTRMVEEERTQIGTLKALGYGKLAIASKYLCYALFATLGGSVIGILFGEKFLPFVIVTAYKIMYHHMPNIVLPYNIRFAAVATAAALFSTMAGTLAACYRELAATPAILMRPPTPKEGKRVLLEYIPILWKPLSFSWKSTVRNLFRYKKRFFMTVFGIGGCMALMLVGFGLRDSIMDVANLQFRDLQIYDGMVILDSEADAAKKDALEARIAQDERIENSARILMRSCTVKNGKKMWDLYVMTPENEAGFSDFVVFRDRVSKEGRTLTDEGAIITEKIAGMMGVQEGDTITVEDEDLGKAEIPIAAVTENYLSHYIYLTPALYEQCFGEKPSYDTILYRVKEDCGEEITAAGEDFLTSDAALSISYTGSIMSQLNDMLASLDLVIVVLIVSAGLLAFVVLYNLSNININERKRELATLKVLGFFDGEVSAYVYRENILITVIGVLVGAGLGVILHRFTITTVEVDACMFGRGIKPASFLISGAFTVGFSVFVNIVMHFKLKKIDMVESLKSVE